jgi:alcohol dehydrogenase class IV
LARSGLPQRLRDVRIPREAISMLTADAMRQTRLLPNNPREVTEANVLAMYGLAW